MSDTKSDLFAPGISGRGDLAPTVCWAGNRGYSIRIWYKSARKVDMAAKATAIEAHPDRLQTELAAEFGVRPSTIHSKSLPVRGWLG